MKKKLINIIMNNQLKVKRNNKNESNNRLKSYKKIIILIFGLKTKRTEITK